MKKLFLSLAFASATIGSAAAQGFTYGLKAGANYSNLWGKNAPNSNSYKIGFVGGLAANYAFNDFASVQIEALYSNKGYKVTEVEVNGPNGAKYKAEGSQTINYVDFPILAHINAGPVFFEAGPQIGIKTDSKIKSNFKVKDAAGNVVNEGSSEADQDAIIGFKRIDKKTGGIPSFDIGIVAGLGYNITPMLSFGVRYNAGLKTLVDSKNVEAGNEARVFNNAFQAQLGYMFGSKM